MAYLKSRKSWLSAKISLIDRRAKIDWSRV
jgi:hypothetical protein